MIVFWLYYFYYFLNMLPSSLRLVDNYTCIETIFVWMRLRRVVTIYFQAPCTIFFLLTYLFYLLTYLFLLLFCFLWRINVFI